VGEPFKEHIRRLRLERAAQRLKRLDEPVTGLALDAGFETHEAFTRAFKSMFGTSPSDYRAAHKPAPESPSGTHFEETGSYHPPDYGELTPVEVKEIRGARGLHPSRRALRPGGRHVGEIDELGRPRGLLGAHTRMIGIVHDNPDVTPPEKVRYDAAIAVNRPVQPEGEFGVQELPGGRYALMQHRGPYAGLGAAYQRLYGGGCQRAGINYAKRRRSKST